MSVPGATRVYIAGSLRRRRRARARAGAGASPAHGAAARAGRRGRGVQRDGRRMALPYHRNRPGPAGRWWPSAASGRRGGRAGSLALVRADQAGAPRLAGREGDRARGSALEAGMDPANPDRAAQSRPAAGQRGRGGRAERATVGAARSTSRWRSIACSPAGPHDRRLVLCDESGDGAPIAEAAARLARSGWRC